MMTKCPRCGFSQPEDQYCARCGVNMYTYKPAEKSAFKKLTENVAVQIVFLLAAAVIAGSYFLQGSPSSQWGKKSDRLAQRSQKPATQPQLTNTESASTSNTHDSFGGLANKEITIDTSATETLEATQPSNSSLPKAPPHQAESAEIKTAAADSHDSAEATNGVLFKLTYAEVHRDVLQRWINDSSAAGLFQNLNEYSAGILPDFIKRGDRINQFLKTSEKRIMIGQSETNVSGKMSDDGSQVTGLTTNYDLKSFEAGTVRGSVTVSRTGRQNRDRFPAEFELPKGAVFFIVDTLTPQSFVSERQILNMAPFQIFKSPDFMTQTTKFVILIEPIVK